MIRYIAENGLAVCSISTIVKRLESKDCVFAPYAQDTITTVDSEVYDSIGGHKHSLDQDTCGKWYAFH